MSAGYMFYQLKKGSHRVRGSQAAKKVKSVFCSGVYVAKNTLRKARSGAKPLYSKRAMPF